MDLEAIPGIGRKTAEALTHLEDPEGAVERGDAASRSCSANTPNVLDVERFHLYHYTSSGKPHYLVCE